MSSTALTITDARLADGTVTSVRIVDGVVVSNGRPPEPGDERLDAAGGLLLPAMVEPHAHLDKAYLAETVPNPTGDLIGAIRGMIDHAPAIDRADVEARAERAALAYAASGTTAVRTHVDLTLDNGVAWLEGVLAVRDRLRDLVLLEVVALCGWPVCGPEGAGQRALLDEAVAMGVDVVGGCPHLDEHPSAALEYLLEVADRAGRPVDLHTDEHTDPTRSTLLTLADRVDVTGFSGGVTASHCVSLGMMDLHTQHHIAERLAASGVHVVTLPSTNLFLQGRDHQTAMPRGLTALAALHAAGVNVAAGWDNLQDPFNPMGRADCLETASLLVMAGHQLPDAAYEAVSNAGRKVIGLPPAGTDPGMAGDLVVLPETTIRGAIASAPATRTVVRTGRVLQHPTDRPLSPSRVVR